MRAVLSFPLPPFGCDFVCEATAVLYFLMLSFDTFQVMIPAKFFFLILFLGI